MQNHALVFFRQRSGQTVLLGTGKPANASRHIELRSFKAGETISGVVPTWDTAYFTVRNETICKRYQWGVCCDCDSSATTTSPNTASTGIIYGGTAHAVVTSDPGTNTDQASATNTDQASASSSRCCITIETTAIAPQRLQLDVRFSHISFGGIEHCLLIDIAGGVWAFGSNEYGQCGVGKSCKGPITSPVQLKGFGPEKPNSRAVSVSCGWNHSAVLTEDGQLYMFGLNTHNQCGVPNGGGEEASTDVGVGQKRAREETLEVMSTAFCKFDPTRVDVLDDATDAWNAAQSIFYPTHVARGPIKQVSCSAWHSSFIAVDGSAYTVGNGRYGQLGHEYPPVHTSIKLPVSGLMPLYEGEEDTPRRVEAFAETTVQATYAGPRSTAFVCEEGALWVSGSLWGDEFACVPQRVDWAALDERFASSAAVCTQAVYFGHDFMVAHVICTPAVGT